MSNLFANSLKAIDTWFDFFENFLPEHCRCSETLPASHKYYDLANAICVGLMTFQFPNPKMFVKMLQLKNYRNLINLRVTLMKFISRIPRERVCNVSNASNGEIQQRPSIPSAELSGTYHYSSSWTWHECMRGGFRSNSEHVNRTSSQANSRLVLIVEQLHRGSYPSWEDFFTITPQFSFQKRVL